LNVIISIWCKQRRTPVNTWTFSRSSNVMINPMMWINGCIFSKFVYFVSNQLYNWTGLEFRRILMYFLSIKSRRFSESQIFFFTFFTFISLFFTFFWTGLIWVDLSTILRKGWANLWNSKILWQKQKSLHSILKRTLVVTLNWWMKIKIMVIFEILV